MIIPTSQGLIEPLVGQNSFFITHHGSVVSKSNHRQDMKSKGSWAKVSAFETSLYWLFKTHVPTEWVLGSIEETIAQRPKIVVALAARCLLDTGNLSKSVLDAAQNVIFHTDASVVSCSEMVYRTKNNPGLIAAFSLLSPQVTVNEIFETQSLLNSWLSSTLSA